MWAVAGTEGKRFPFGDNRPIWEWSKGRPVMVHVGSCGLGSAAGGLVGTPTTAGRCTCPPRWPYQLNTGSPEPSVSVPQEGGAGGHSDVPFRSDQANASGTTTHRTRNFTKNERVRHEVWGIGWIVNIISDKSVDVIFPSGGLVLCAVAMLHHGHLVERWEDSD